MKKIFTVLAFAAIFVGCAKETESFYKPVSGEAMFLRADIPAMTDITKATADGSFSWAEDDEIAVPIDGGYAVFQYKTAQSAFTYTPSGSETFVNGTVYYPASSRPSGSYSTTFASQDAARAGFKMTAPYTAGASSLTFTHVSSLIKLSFNNVPSFATSVAVKEGDDVVATVALPSPAPSSVEVKVPVTPNGTKTYSFELKEGANVLKGVTKTVSLTAGTYYTTPEITLNKYIVFTNSSDDGHKLGLMSRTWNSSTDNWDAKADWNGELSLTNTGDLKYYILTEPYASAEAIQVELRKGEDKISETALVILDRNLTFDVSENTLKSKYRIYLTPDASYFKTVCNIYGWDNSLGTWPGVEMTTVDGKFVYEFEPSWYGVTKNFLFSDGTAQTSDSNKWGPTINQDHTATINRWGDDETDGRNLWLTKKW